MNLNLCWLFIRIGIPIIYKFDPITHKNETPCWTAIEPTFFLSNTSINKFIRSCACVCAKKPVSEKKRLQLFDKLRLNPFVLVANVAAKCVCALNFLPGGFCICKQITHTQRITSVLIVENAISFLFWFDTKRPHNSLSCACVRMRAHIVRYSVASQYNTLHFKSRDTRHESWTCNVLAQARVNQTTNR